MERASKRLVRVEDLSETELQRLKQRYRRLVAEVAAEQASRDIVQRSGERSYSPDPQGPLKRRGIGRYSTVGGRRTG